MKSSTTSTCPCFHMKYASVSSNIYLKPTVFHPVSSSSPSSKTYSTLASIISKWTNKSLFFLNTSSPYPNSKDFNMKLKYSNWYFYLFPRMQSVSTIWTALIQYSISWWLSAINLKKHYGTKPSRFQYKCRFYTLLNFHNSHKNNKYSHLICSISSG